MTVVGAREIDPGEKELIARLGVRVFTMSEVDEIGVAACMDEALERANAGTAGFHLSLDLDSLDPAVAPGVGTPVQGGLTYREGPLGLRKGVSEQPHGEPGGRGAQPGARRPQPHSVAGDRAVGVGVREDGVVVVGPVTWIRSTAAGRTRPSGSSGCFLLALGAPAGVVKWYTQGT